MVSAALNVKFNRRGVETALGKKERTVLYRTAAFVRKSLPRKMKKSKSSSNPNQYPKRHAGLLAKTSLWRFDVDLKAGTALVFPIVFDDKRVSSGQSVPDLLQAGGTIRREVGLPSGDRDIVSQTYRPRPFIDLFLGTAADKLRENYAKTPLRK